MQNFDRQYRLTAGQAGQAGFEIGGRPTPLHVSFSFQRADLKSQNTGKVSIWNLNPQHLAELGKDDCVVSLNAGYPGFGGEDEMQEMKKLEGAALHTNGPMRTSAPTEVIIRLPEETVNYLQRLDYEIGGLQVLHTHALKAGTPLDKRMEIKREFQETFAEYQMAKNEMWAEYAPRFPGAARWWVDFQTGELHIGGASAATSGHRRPKAATSGRSPEANDARWPEANDARREPPSQQESPRPFGAPPFNKGGEGHNPQSASQTAPFKRGLEGGEPHA